MTNTDQTEDRYQAAVAWLQQMELGTHDVHTDREGGDFLFMAGDQIADFEEMDEHIFDGCEIKKIGHDIAEDTGRYRVYLPEKYQDLV